MDKQHCYKCYHWIEAIWDPEEGDSWGYCSWREDPVLGMTGACGDFEEAGDE